MMEDKIKPKDVNNELVIIPQNQMDIQVAENSQHGPKPLPRILEKTPKLFFLSVVQLSIILRLEFLLNTVISFMIVKC